MKHTESGRTMLETLGTLAIVGVISAGGLYGFNAAMNRHRANELLNEANKQAVMVASSLMTNPDPEGEIALTGVPNSPYGTFGNSIQFDGDKFKMTLSGLDEGLCDLMKNLAAGPIRRVECVEGEDGSTAEIYFNKDLSTEERASDYSYANCPNKYYPCEATKKCVASAEECLGGPCEVLECGDNGKWDEKTCKCDCNTGWYGKVCDSDCDGWKDFEGFCISCSEIYAHVTTTDECAKCSNRKLFYTEEFDPDDPYENGYCGLKDCGNNAFRFVYPEYDCGLCAMEGNYAGVYVSKKECDKCENRELPFPEEYEGEYYGYCMVKCELAGDYFFGREFSKDSQGNLVSINPPSCISCSLSAPVISTSEYCSKCDGTNYRRIMDGEYCVPENYAEFLKTT